MVREPRAVGSPLAAGRVDGSMVTVAKRFTLNMPRGSWAAVLRAGTRAKAATRAKKTTIDVGIHRCVRQPRVTVHLLWPERGPLSEVCHLSLTKSTAAEPAA